MDCPDCLLEIWTEAAGRPDAPGFCECPVIRPKEYDYRWGEKVYTEEDASED